jgi:hypothetical protein
MREMKSITARRAVRDGSFATLSRQAGEMAALAMPVTILLPGRI